MGSPQTPMVAKQKKVAPKVEPGRLEAHSAIGKEFYKWLILMVPRGGLEPPRPCGLRILSPLRLPISPSGHDCSNISKQKA
jgi:hypothetical protein